VINILAVIYILLRYTVGEDLQKIKVLLMALPLRDKKKSVYLEMTRYTEIIFFRISDNNIVQDFFVMQHISANPLVSGYLGFNLLTL